jgi:predicted Rossmann fold flavoprotein
VEVYDVIVVGGGPAGMMAAGRAAQVGRRVLLLEKNCVVGKKLNLTGGGRCNITNAEFDDRVLLGNFGDSGKFLFSPFAQFSVQETFDFFDELGLPFKVEPGLRAFPDTERAADVTKVLQRYMELHGVRVRTGCEVVGVVVKKGRVTEVKTSAGSFGCESLILASGGAAYPETGSDGAGFRWLREMGHRVHKANPDVVPLQVEDAWVKQLSGTSLQKMRITFQAVDGETLVREGRLLFTHFGLSGPLILNNAHEVKRLLAQGPVRGEINLFPEQEPKMLDALILRQFSATPNRSLQNAIKGLLPAGMTNTVCSFLERDVVAKPVNQISASERRVLLNLLQALPLTVTGTMGFDWAVICDGGVELKEVDTKTMASRLVPNLYLVGDLLNISRPSGGFSLQLCWTTGWVAGSAA